MIIGTGMARRQVLAAGASLAALALARPGVAASLIPTPAQTEGPFYPETLPPDSDNDLVRVAGRDAAAAGIVLLLSGRVLDVEGRPIGGAAVEIWQCDAAGRYHHPRDRRGPADANFQGYGRAVADSDGSYHFRTIKPVPYPGRTPHIHFRVLAPDRPHLTTQMYVAGEQGNARDFLLNAIRGAAARERVIVDLNPADASEAGALAGRFDIVLPRPA